jgi:hypothetical protein
VTSIILSQIYFRWENAPRLSSFHWTILDGKVLLLKVENLDLE